MAMQEFLSFDEGEDDVLENGLVGRTVYFLISNRALPANVNAPAVGEHGGGDHLATGVGEISYWTGGARQSQVVPDALDGIISFTLEEWDTGDAVNGPANARSIVMVTTPDNTGVAIAAWPLKDATATPITVSGTPADLSKANAHISFQPTYFYLNVGES